jgi:hypothetical protein
VAEQATLELDMIAVEETNRNFARGENEHEGSTTRSMHTTTFQEYAAPTIGLGNAGNEFFVQHMLARQDNWKELNDRYEHARLYAALKRVKGGET